MSSVRDNITYMFCIRSVYLKKKKTNIAIFILRGGCFGVLQRQGRSSVPIASSVATLGLDLQTDRSRTT